MIFMSGGKMKSIKIAAILTIVLIPLVSSNALSKKITVTTSAGETISGDVIEATHDYIKIKSSEGKIHEIKASDVYKIDDPSEKIPEPIAGKLATTPQQEKTNEKFINASLKEHGSKEKASEANVEFGWQYYNSGDPLTAMKRFNQAWLLNPDNADVYWGFGLILLDQNKSGRAIEMFDKSLSLNPNNENVYLNRSHAYEQLEDFKQAIADSTKAIEINPNNAQAYNDRGAFYFHSGQYEKSWADAQKAQDMGYEVHPGFLAALKSKGYSE